MSLFLTGRNYNYLHTAPPDAKSLYNADSKNRQEHIPLPVFITSC